MQPQKKLRKKRKARPPRKKQKIMQLPQSPVLIAPLHRHLSQLPRDYIILGRPLQPNPPASQIRNLAISCQFRLLLVIRMLRCHPMVSSRLLTINRSRATLVHPLIFSGWFDVRKSFCAKIICCGVICKRRLSGT